MSNLKYLIAGEFLKVAEGEDPSQAFLQATDPGRQIGRQEMQQFASQFAPPPPQSAAPPQPMQFGGPVQSAAPPMPMQFGPPPGMPPQQPMMAPPAFQPAQQEPQWYGPVPGGGQFGEAPPVAPPVGQQPPVYGVQSPAFMYDNEGAGNDPQQQAQQQPAPFADWKTQ